MCASLLTQDHEIIELVGEEEKEKEIEIEKELEQIKHVKDIASSARIKIQNSINLADYLVFQGRDHLQNNTPPPESVSFIG